VRAPAAVLASIVIISAALAHAQTSPADGVDAFLRGDYQQAAAILKPLAEGSRDPDHVAEFFLAAMYQSGRGVPVDVTRACALYMRAGSMRMFSNGVSPFARQADGLLRGLRLSLGREQFEDCSLLANIGFDHRFEPVTFSLEAGHWITWDLRGVTISYQGRETRKPMQLAVGRVAYLPIQHTELQVGPTRSDRRHFIEVFLWQADKAAQTWGLRWHLFEVVRDDLLYVVPQTAVVTMPGKDAPLDSAFDVRTVVRLRVNENGDPEWAILSGPNQRSGVIESEAERQEVRQRTLTRQAAESRVDWKRVRDVHRAPSLAYSDADGCGNAFAFGWSADRTEVLAARADVRLLELSTTARTFDIAAIKSGLELVVHVYERPMRSWPFCTDVGMSGLQDETWRAARGSVTIELSRSGVRVNQPHLYRVTIRIDGAEFVNAAGVRIRQVQPITLSALAGSMFG
jgi:hypothetical protein